MAKKNSTAKPAFYEVVFRGKPKVVRAFLCGLELGSGQEATVFYNYLHGVYHEGKVEKLAELVGMRADDCHAIVDREISDLLRKLKKRIANRTRLEIMSHRRIRSASLSFDFQAFAPQYTQEIVELVKSLPAGLRLSGFKHDVKLNPGAKGVEAYSVVHHYVAKGEGTISGQVDTLIAFRQELDKFPLIKASDIVLKFA